MNESVLIIFVVMFLVFLIVSVFSSTKEKQDFSRHGHSSHSEDNQNVITLNSLQDRLKKHIIANNTKERSVEVDGILYTVSSDDLYSKCMRFSFNAFQVLQRIPLVYSMVLDSFVSNDKNRLRYFLSEALFEKKKAFLDKLEEKSHKYHCSVICFEKLSLEDFTVVDRVSRIYSIDVLLKLQVCRYIKDDTNTIIKGCDNFIEDISEKWRCRSLGIRSVLSKRRSSWLIDDMERVQNID